MIQAPSQTPADRLEQMVRKYEKDLLRICFVYLGDWAQAEDAVQETFLKAYRSMDSFRGDSSDKTWLIQIAMNRCRDVKRSAWLRHAELKTPIEQMELPSPPPSDEHIALTAAIMKLKPKYLEVVLLYYYEGYSTKDIANMLSLTQAAVSLRLSKAKQKLRDELEGGKGDEN